MIFNQRENVMREKKSAKAILMAAKAALDYQTLG